MTLPVDPIDPTPTAEFPSWELALTEGRLKREQFVTLQTMVDEGKASTLKEAASVLDLEETIIHPAEHMWGTSQIIRFVLVSGADEKSTLDAKSESSVSVRFSYLISRHADNIRSRITFHIQN